MLLLYYRLKKKRKNRRKDNSGSINSEKLVVSYTIDSERKSSNLKEIQEWYL